MRQSASSKASNDAAGIHARLRDPSTGRVNKCNLKAKYRVANLSAYIKKELEKVGILASGWNAAAAKLGAKMPDWISRQHQVHVQPRRMPDHHHQHQQLRTFVLSRMRDVRLTTTKFKRPADFEISKHLGSSFSVFSGKGHYRIRLQFDAFAARLVSERRWHASQKIKPLGKDGSEGIEMSLELSDLEEITRWILSWGGQAKVLAPKELQTRVRNAAELLLQG